MEVLRSGIRHNEQIVSCMSKIKQTATACKQKCKRKFECCKDIWTTITAPPWAQSLTEMYKHHNLNQDYSCWYLDWFLKGRYCLDCDCQHEPWVFQLKFLNPYNSTVGYWNQVEREFCWYIKPKLCWYINPISFNLCTFDFWLKYKITLKFFFFFDSVLQRLRVQQVDWDFCPIFVVFLLPLVLIKRFWIRRPLWSWATHLRCKSTVIRISNN